MTVPDLERVSQWIAMILVGMFALTLLGVGAIIIPIVAVPLAIVALAVLVAWWLKN